MERKEAIKTLKSLSECSYVDSFEPEEKEALEMAIRCLKVDEMYDLFYEDADWYDKAIKENERLKKELEMLKLDRECDKFTKIQKLFKDFYTWGNNKRSEDLVREVWKILNGVEEQGENIDGKV